MIQSAVTKPDSVAIIEVYFTCNLLVLKDWHFNQKETAWLKHLPCGVI